MVKVCFRLGIIALQCLVGTKPCVQRVAQVFIPLLCNKGPLPLGGQMIKRIEQFSND